MRPTLFILVLLSSFYNWNGSASAQNTFFKIYDTDWYESVNNILETSSHDYMITGATGNPTVSYALVMKVDENGDIIWEKHLEHFTPYVSGSLIIRGRDDNGYLVLGYGNNVFLHRIDEDGNSESHLIEIDSLGYVESMVLTLDGNLIMAGEIPQYKSLLNDIILVKTDLDGVVLWAKFFGASDRGERARKIFQLDDGGFIVIGNEYSAEDGLVEDVLIFRIDSDGDVIWRKVFNWAHQDHPTDMIETKDGAYVFLNFEADYGRVDQNRVVKIDKNGGIIWEKLMKGIKHGFARTIVEIPSGGYMITGFFQEPYSSLPMPPYETLFWRLSSDGELLWQKKYTFSPIESAGWDIINTYDGNFMTVGQIVNNSSFNIFILKTDSLGCHMSYPGLGKDTVTCTGPITLNAGSDYDNYQWSTGETIPSIEVHASGEYTLTVGTENECFKSDTLLVTIKDCSLYDRCKNIGYAEEEIKLSNVITPNGDKWNEFFIVPDMMLESKLSIYNRWGSLVYFNEKYDNSWNGEGLGSGNYYYTLVNKCLSKEFKGLLSILRE